MQPLKITLSLPPRGLSPNEASHRHWRARASATKSHREECELVAKLAKPANWGETPVEITAEFYCALTPVEKAIRQARKVGKSQGFRSSRHYRPLDTMNAIASLKAAVDGLVDAGIVPKDTAKWVNWRTVKIYRTQREHKGRAALDLTIHPVGVAL